MAKISNGWVSVRTSDEVAVHLRVSEGPRGEMVVTGLLVEGDEITTDTLRRLQPARILAGIENDDVVRFFARSTAGTDDSRLTLGQMRARVVASPKPSRRRPLGRPDGADPDQFSRRVAEVYRSAAQESSRPAVLLADENDVPVETVRRWIKEARRRGHLPPGSRGRAI